MAGERNLVQALEALGLRENEVKVYLALLKLGSCTAYQVAQQSGVKRPTVYVILEELRKKGLVLKVPHAKKALYAARDIAEYLQDKRRDIHAAEAIVPQLHALAGSTRPNVYFFNGMRGMSEALDFKFDSIKGKTLHSFYGNLLGANKDIMRLYSAWDKRALANDVSFKIIMPDDAKDKYYMDIVALAETAPESVQIRYLKDYLYPSNISIEIADSFIRIDDERNLQATVIDDVQTADAMRQIFNIVWEKGV